MKLSRNWKSMNVVSFMLTNQMFFVLMKFWTFEQLQLRLESERIIPIQCLSLHKTLILIKFQIEYLVKWEGYSAEHNEWVPEEDVSIDLKRSFKLRTFNFYLLLHSNLKDTRNFSR